MAVRRLSLFDENAQKVKLANSEFLKEYLGHKMDSRAVAANDFVSKSGNTEVAPSAAAITPTPALSDLSTAEFTDLPQNILMPETGEISSHAKEIATISSSVVVLASLCGAAVLAALVFLLYRVYRRRCQGRSKYERLGGLGGVNFKMPPPPSVQIDGKSLSTPSVSLKTVPFTLPPAPVQRERIGGFTFPPPSSPSKEFIDQSQGWNTERRASYTGAPHLGAGHQERRSSLVDDGNSRRDSLGTVSMGSVDSDGSPTHGNGGLVAKNDSRRPSLVEVPQGAFVLGGLNPDLYKIQDEEEESDFPDDHIGRIWFAVEYELESERLVVSLIKARNLPSRTLGVGNQCDPLVKVFLLPEERRHLQSKVKRKTTNPKFDESFVFQVTFKALQLRTLRLSVFDVDRSKKHRLIGHAMYPLEDLDYETHQKMVMWLDLDKEVNETTSEKGDIHFSLNYNNTQERLTVVVLEAKGLKLLDGYQHVDSYVKVSLMTASKVAKAKKTEVIKKDPNPNYNESFQFKVPSESLDTISISVAMMQHSPGVKGDKQIGRVVVGPFMYARGKELEHWNEMVGRMKESVAQWHSLT